MISFSLLFLLGDLFLQQFKTLPSINWVIGIFLFSLLLMKYFRSLTFFILGFTWAFFFAHQQLNWKIPESDQGKPVLITGYIYSLPSISKDKTTFDFSLKKFNQQPAKGLLKLTWYYPTTMLNVGDKWQFKVRTKQIHTLMNPNTFDYEAWAFQANVRGEGSVINAEENQIINHHLYHFPLQRLRQNLKEKITKNLPTTETAPWILALALGERQNISPDKWEVLRNTGTNHLMAIAGLHIGCMSGLIFFIAMFIARRIPVLCLKIPAQHIGALAALMMAITYGALAGFIIPTERACIMIAIFLIISLLKRKTVAWQAWSLALTIVLLLNPLVVLAESFWLSFGSVALIIYGMHGRLNPKGVWWKYGRIQWVIALGLIPLSIWLFQQCSLISFIANSIAIPWVAFIIVPLTLCGVFCLLFSVKIGASILWLADKNLSWLWFVLHALAKLPIANWYQTMPNATMLIVSMLGVVILLLPRGFPGRWFGIILLLPLVFYQPVNIPNGAVKLTLLDVGEGLSTIIQTKNHLLVFDAGDRISDNFDMGESVLVPFLHYLHIKKIDKLIISEIDRDHIGGALSLFKNFSVKNIETSAPEFFVAEKGNACVIHESWRWDNVEFIFLKDHPCVLKIITAHKAILLTSDIKKSAEKELLSDENVSANVLIAPDHGSLAGMTAAFVKAVNAQYVLFPVGFRNRYHFPNFSVVEKYQEQGAGIADSVNDGAITIDVFVDNISKPIFYRLTHRRYWN